MLIPRPYLSLSSRLRGHFAVNGCRVINSLIAEVPEGIGSRKRLVEVAQLLQLMVRQLVWQRGITQRRTFLLGDVGQV